MERVLGLLRGQPPICTLKDMKINELLTLVRNKGIDLWVEREKLRYSAPAGAITPALAAELLNQQAEILKILRNTDAISPAPRNQILPLSFAQERLWIMDQLEPHSSVFNMPVALRLKGSLDVPALRRSLNEIVRRHEALRTSFIDNEGSPQQVVLAALTLPLPVLDLSDHPENDRENEARRIFTEETHRSFDLSREPLVRTMLIRLHQGEHCLVLNMHHIVSDGWSMGVFFKELSILYEASCTGKLHRLPELPIQYADYSIWQREFLRGEVLERQLSYWKKQLDNVSALQLPIDRPRPSSQSYRGKRETLVLANDLAERLKVLSRKEGVTLFMTLLAAYQTLLHRYTGQDDIVVGSPIAGRNRREIEGLIGFFVNTLVLRADLSGNPTFRQMLARVRDVALDAYAHQDIPFEKLLEELRPQRDPSRTPLFQVFFNMLNVDRNLPRFRGLSVEPMGPEEPHSKFDLTIYAGERQGQLCLDAVFNADIFRRDRMTEMLGQLEFLLSQVAENPDRRIAEYSLITARAERILPNPSQLLSCEWKGAVHERFSLQARMSAQQPAVVDGLRSWTYGELNRHANQIARYMLAQGINRGDVIAVYAHRDATLVCAILAILKAGAVFFILDPAYPAARQIACIDGAEPRAWLHLEAAGALLPTVAEHVGKSSFRCKLRLSAATEAILDRHLNDYAVDDPRVDIGPDDLAYVAFTSGSTGRPKGVLGRHGPLSHFLPWQEDVFELGYADRFCMLSSLSHDPLQRDIFTPLWLGATLCIPSDDLIGTSKLAEWMAKERISFAHLTPAMAQMLAETAAPDCRLPSLRYAFFLGDKLTRRDVARLRRLAPSVTCISSYGTTETQRAVGYYVVPQETQHKERRGKAVYPVGRGIEDVQLLVLTGEQRLAGVGELGEICVRSPHLAKGYFGDETLTQSRFLSNPFTGAAGDRIYRTGDVGRYLPDGDVEFAGRADRQAKIRGFRVEPEEIEAVLGQHPSVREVVVLAREDVTKEQGEAGQLNSEMENSKLILVAYLITHGDQALTTNDLQSFVKSKLPAYMVPSAFVLLDALPLTPHGKVDYRALPGPDESRPELEQRFVAPRTPIEEALARIWAEVLKLEHVGIHDNFFDLGGHSLLATQVISRIHHAFHGDLPLRALFENPTVASLAVQISRIQSSETGVEALGEIMDDLESLSDEEAQNLASRATRGEPV